MMFVIGFCCREGKRCLTYATALSLVVAFVVAARAESPAEVRPHIVVVSDTTVLSLRVEPADDKPSTGIALEQLRFGDAKSLKLETALRAHLDRDANGTILPAELSAAEALLDRLDVDEDECLAPLEIVQDVTAGSAQSSAVRRNVAVVLVRSASDFDELKRVLVQFKKLDAQPLERPDLTLKIANKLGSDFKVQKLPAADAVIEHVEQSGRCRIAKGAVELDLWADSISTPQTGRPAEAKPTDASSIKSTVAVQLRPGRRGWFEWLDGNGDGKLSRVELRRASLVLKTDSQFSGSGDDRHSFAVRIGQPGTMRRTFIPLLGDPNHSDKAVGALPGWFAAMDANGDGSISRNEFLGGDPLFTQTDADGDGLMSVTEAEALKKLVSMKGPTP